MPTLHVPQSRGAERDARVRISYTLRGRGPILVVCVAGMLVPGSMWTALTEDEALAARVTWVVLDNRGIGASGRPAGWDVGWEVGEMAADVWDVVDCVRGAGAYTKEVGVLGHSMGGMVAQRVAVMRPTEVRWMGLLSTHAGGLWEVLPSWSVVRGLLGWVVGGFRHAGWAEVCAKLHFTERFLNSWVRHGDTNEGRRRRRRRDIIHEWYTGVVKRYDDDGGEEGVALGHLRVVRSHSLSWAEAAALRRCERMVKTVVIGRHDRVITAAASRRLAAAVGARVVVEIDAAHFITDEAPADIAAQVRHGIEEAFRDDRDDCMCALCVPGKDLGDSSWWPEDMRLC